MQGRHHDGLFYIHTGKGMLVSASVLQRINRAVENHFHRARGVTLAGVAALTVAALVPTSVWNANVVGARSLTASSAAATSPARAVESLDGGDGPSRVQQTGRWFTDQEGRAFLTQGVNMVYKHAPYTAEAAGFDENDAQWLAEQGFDSLRLGVMWKAVEPAPGIYDDAYLDSLVRTTDLLHRHGIYVLLDAHQDMYNERFEGEFAPDWAVKDDGLPSQARVGFPGNQAVNIGLIRAYDNFLANAPGTDGVGLRDRFAAMWGHVASRFANHPGIMGYDVLNEPWPGSAYPLCYLTGGNCGTAANSALTALHQQVADAITAEDPHAIIHFEPYSPWNIGLNTNPQRPQTEQAALSWHVYCVSNALANRYTGCELLDGRVFDNAERVATSQNTATILTEFGATDDPETLAGVIGLARNALVGWQYWSYCGCNDPTTQNQKEQGIVEDPTRPGPVTADAVNPEKLRILSAPHLRFTAGTPVSAAWDPATSTYEATWETNRVDGNGAFPAGSVTEIAVPSSNYPTGYIVAVHGGEVRSVEDAGILLIRSTGAEPVTVRVTPKAS